MLRKVRIIITISVLFTICACSQTDSNINTTPDASPAINASSKQSYTTPTIEDPSDTSPAVSSLLPLPSETTPISPFDTFAVPDYQLVTPSNSPSINIIAEQPGTPSPETSNSLSNDLISGDYYYSINSNGSATLTQYNGKGSFIIVPSEFDGKTVTAIGNTFRQNGAFANCNTIEYVIIPTGVTVIEDNAFQSCTNLASVIIPSSVTLLRNCAFDDCSNLCSVFFEGNAPQKGNYVFAGTNPNLVIYRHEGTSGWESDAWSSLTIQVY